MGMQLLCLVRAYVAAGTRNSLEEQRRFGMQICILNQVDCLSQDYHQRPQTDA